VFGHTLRFTKAMSIVQIRSGLCVDSLLISDFASK
jgi:hypothetical protein